LNIDNDRLIELLKKAENNYLESIESSVKYNSITAIIDIKIILGKNGNFKIYRDIKRLIKSACECSIENLYEYEKIDCEKIVSYIEQLNVDERHRSYKFFEKKLIESGFVEDAILINKYFKKAEIMYLKRKDLGEKLFILPYKYLTYNYATLIASFFIFYALCFIVLLPSFSPSSTFFRFQKIAFTDNFVIDHSLNVLSLLMNIDNGYSLTYLSWAGIILATVAKVFTIFVVIGVFKKEIENRLARK